MREILFRGKRADNGEWAEGYFAESSGSFILADNGLTYGGFEMLEVDPETVCQYTGKEDRFATKIFEDSIVKEKFGDCIGIVKFGEFENGYGYHIQWVSEDARFYREDLTYWLKEVSLEVVGNIFDNLELLG